ncbi:LLM class flavin-dependent oxidoreductase [Pseudonocardia spinosispora]|uniref:LLM class flavin-dependent oxidoreductase n=1 Tax=Pseudonocardia spinosispora TaxID=103441 RepID=UPI0003FE87E2|nr:LLM class flavin-dependent oxidoreductase [Pseudonocardia spinosispora]
MPLTLSCALNTSLDSHEHARIAEQLGYDTVWFYDSPALYADVWVQLCRAAERTERVQLGPGVLVPTLRHPMASASAISTLVSIAGQDRVAVTVGSGFTGRLTLGQRPAKWAFVAEYIRTLRALLRGEQTEWEGAQIRMMQYPGFGSPRPIDVPILVGAAGPKGIGVAHEIGDGVFAASVPIPGFDRSIVLTFGTVLEDGEDPGSPRALEAAGHGASVTLHYCLEFGLLDDLPNGHDWAAAYDDVPADVKHLALHDGHLAVLNERDKPFVTGEVLSSTGLALSPDALRERVAALAEQGATEIAYQPAGPDVARELEAFAKAVL